MIIQHWQVRYCFINYPIPTLSGQKVEVVFHHDVNREGPHAQVYVSNALIWDGPFDGEPTVKDAELLAYRAWHNPKKYPDATIPG